MTEVYVRFNLYQVICRSAVHSGLDTKSTASAIARRCARPANDVNIRRRVPKDDQSARLFSVGRLRHDSRLLSGRKSAGSERTRRANDAANQLVTAIAASGTTIFTFDAAGNQQLERAPGDHHERLELRKPADASLASDRSAPDYDLQC
jgi:YD repeat-containing protein